MKRVHECWCDFDRGVIPEEAPEVYRKEMRRAFYAGFQGLLCMLVEVADANEDAGCELLNSVRDELEEFKAEVLQGTK